ncbi:Transposase IS66 family protein [Planctomycetes bacterium Poly30]|uniref:Transposase IS66 family protein n=1 Tax=Saltatorellus ferox TaxID=2528018 RepID=A0A518EMI9_9BACT|nr:Transposase IS66 family protein [Planctomycetes bacterium Poly30]
MSEETIKELRAEVKELRERVNDLLGVVERQGAEIKRLKARKPTTSRNSSKPPSSDNPFVSRPSKKRPSGKKRGGQPGHLGRGRDQAAPEDVDEVKVVKPDQCGSCSALLTGEDPSPRRHQIIDIPPVDPTILEVQLHTLLCDSCGAETKADLPDDLHASNFGPHLSALVVTLTGDKRMSRRNVQEFTRDWYSIEISLGAITNIEQRMSSGFERGHSQAMSAVAESAVKHADETPWKQSGALGWMWVAASALATVFLIRSSRATEVARELLGDEPTGITISDRYSGYLFINLDQRQVCLAHLSRDFVRMAEGEPDFRWIGARLSNALEEVFRLWHLFKGGDIKRPLLQRWTSQLRARMFALLDEGARSSGYETPGMCRGILKTEPAMWTYLYHAGVEPTNNVGEQKARIGVMYRKVSQGTRSDRGSRFVERVLTTSATLRQQGRSVAQHIVDVAHTVLTGAPEPDLIK